MSSPDSGLDGYDVYGDPGRQSRLQEVLNHEIGHLFYLWHPYGKPGEAQRPNGDVMETSPTRKAGVFGARCLHEARKKTKPGN
jgi:hypothetical protein